MKNEISRVLCDLKKSASTEKSLAALVALNEIIQSNRNEIDFLHKTDGFNVIMSVMKTDDKLANLCLRILANASKRDGKIRTKLLSSDIFDLLASLLRNDIDLSKNNVVLYTTMIVILVQGNQDGQNQMRDSGCLSCLIEILYCVLNDEEKKRLPWRKIELIIYAIIVCIKDPWHHEIQIEVGWITPKILEYLQQQTLSSDENFELVKCFWSFLKSILNKNEVNQKIFINHSGSTVLFRSMQEILDDGEINKMGDLLKKMTGILVMLRSQKEFLHQAANYCSVMILCRMLNTTNSLVIQHVILFLDSLTKEIPQALRMVKDQKVLRGIKKAKIILQKSKMTAELCQDVWNSINLSESSPSNLNSSKEDFDQDATIDEASGSDKSSLYQTPQNYFCTIHDTNLFKDVQIYTKPKSSGNHVYRNLYRMPNTHLKFPKMKELKQTRIRKIEKPKLGQLKRKKGNFNIFKLVGGGIWGFVQKFWSYLKGNSDSPVKYLEIGCEEEEEFCSEACKMFNNRLFEYQNAMASVKIRP